MAAEVHPTKMTESTPAKGTRSQTSFSFLCYDNPIRPYKLNINGNEFPGYVMIGEGYIFFNIEPNINRSEACIELMIHGSWHPIYDENVLYLHSYYDTKINKECHDYYKSRGITHAIMFDVFSMLANQLEIPRIELYDGSSIKLPQCKWNLRILNRLLQHSNQVPQHKYQPQTFYEKFGFQPYDKIDLLSRKYLHDLSPFMREYIHKNKIPQGSGAEPILIEVVKHMYRQCNDMLPFDEYEQLKDEIIRLLDISPTSDLYYKDIDIAKRMNYAFNRATNTIEFTNPLGGKKSKKNKIRKVKSKKH